MPLNRSQRLTNAMKGAIAVAIISGVALAVPMLVPSDSPTDAWIVRPKVHNVWVMLDQADVMSGATVPPDVHVVFHVPETVIRINREVLLGLKGKKTRYWGYCYPENSDPEVVARRTGLRGLMFMSEKERAVRAETSITPEFSLQNLPTTKETLLGATPPETAIRHQVEFFKGGQLCYLMTEAPLAIGIDSDNDRLNDRLEKDRNTDPLVEDTDADGIMDGIEVRFGLNPIRRDTDNDGLIDGIEDKNWNGLIEKGETDPRSVDFDRDGLCDGQCPKSLANGQLLHVGEDRNLNGDVDSDETDPRNADTDGDGSNDLQEYLVCLTAGRLACK